VSEHHIHTPSCHGGHGHDHAHDHGRTDWLLWISGAVVTFAYMLHYRFPHDSLSRLGRFTGAIHEMMNSMFLGVGFGILALGLLSRVPREMVMAVLGSDRGLRGILRATLAGVMFDVCSHGILMVGSKLYERGATIGQTMAFLIASPWNSLSLTFVLISLIGLKWTAAFILLSMAVGISTGLIFDALVARGVLPPNENQPPQVEPGFRFWAEAKARLKNVPWGPRYFFNTLKMGLLESGMVLRWLFLGVIVTGILRVAVTPDALYEKLFGPSLTGLWVTFIASAVMEVCSEGATPIAADIFRRAHAAGNSFAFLMAGVSTNYTTVLVLKQATKSWKIALFLPLVSVPQILLLAYALNHMGAR
jgi:uncharacterized membrane protein YraQ (UPF0718 family)